jgi:DNA invertase Pin-like site-specific DNA recombinase
MRVGYARVSTNDQDLSLQTAALQEAGCEKIFSDKASGGGGTQDRIGLRDALSFTKEGDTLCVWKLDRLGRSVKHLIEISEVLAGQGIHLLSVTDGIDTQTSMGRFFFHIMAALAEMERELIRERTKAGIKAARNAGRVGGRRPAMPGAQREAAKRLLSSGMGYPDVAKAIKVSIPTLYRHFPASGLYSDD